MEMNTSTQLQVACTRAKLKPAAVECSVATEAGQSLRHMLETENTLRGWRTQLARSGFLFIMLFEIAGVLALRLPHLTRSRTIVPFELFNLIAGACCLYITWTVWFNQHWRVIVFGFSAIIILGATFLSLATERSEPLFMSIIILLVGGGSLIPWNARWQGALTLLSLSWLALTALTAHTTDIGLYQWLGLIAAGAIAYSGAHLTDSCTMALMDELNTLRHSNAQLRNALWRLRSVQPTDLSNTSPEPVHPADPSGLRDEQEPAATDTSRAA